MAPVTAGAALSLAEVALLLAALVTELTCELTDLVNELRTDEREAASEPVAVESWELIDERSLAASELIDETLEDASEVMEETWDPREEVRLERSEAMEVATEVAEPRRPPVVVVVVCWACGNEELVMEVLGVEGLFGRTYCGQSGEGSDDGRVTHFDGLFCLFCLSGR